MRVLVAILSVVISAPVLGQTPGKNQVCDKNGNCATVTGGKLDVNATATAGPIGTAAKGSTASGSPTSTAASVNRQPLDVILYDSAGNAYTAGGGAADAAATSAASESATNRSASFSAIRLLDTAQLAGLQLVAWKGDQTSGAWVNVKSISGSIGNTAFAQTPTAVSPATDTGTCTSVSTNTTVLAASGSRHVALLIAKATNTDRVHIKLGATATTSQPPLEPGQSLSLDSTAFPYTGQIDAIAASGTQSICTVQW